MHTVDTATRQVRLDDDAHEPCRRTDEDSCPPQPAGGVFDAAARRPSA